MGGGNKKRFNKPKNRGRPPNSSLSRDDSFVIGGFLSDWSVVDSPPSRGRNANNGKGNGNENGNSRSASRCGNSKGSGSKTEAQKTRGNTIGYVYPHLVVDFQ
ncbi:unnamed protein product, partial [Ilex paraguariensis]